MNEADADPALVREAVQLALDAARGGDRPFGALVAAPSGVVGRGVDRSTTSGDPLDHAEIGALREARRALGSERLGGCTLYTSCEPCLLCVAAILRSGIAIVYYAAARETAAAYGFPDVVAADALRAVVPAELALCQAPCETAEEPFAAARAG